jgi:hypothetical protein
VDDLHRVQYLVSSVLIDYNHPLMMPAMATIKS